jgi:hypothetical protein
LASSRLETFQFRIRRLLSGLFVVAVGGVLKAKKTEICCQLKINAINGKKAHREWKMAQIRMNRTRRISINGNPSPRMAIGQYLPALKNGIKQASRYTITNKILQVIKNRLVNLFRAPAIIKISYLLRWHV